MSVANDALKALKTLADRTDIGQIYSDVHYREVKRDLNKLEELVPNQSLHNTIIENSKSANPLIPVVFFIDKEKLTEQDNKIIHALLKVLITTVEES